MEKGKVQTVTGLINPNELGFVLPHEHLYHEINTSAFISPHDARHSDMNSREYSIKDLWWITFHPYSHADNFRYNDQRTQAALKNEMVFYRANGGSTIVENSQGTAGWPFLKRLAESTNVNIIAGTGYYVEPGQSETTLRLTNEQVYANMKNDLLEGTNGIKAGIVGEIGTCYPVNPFERKSLKASGELSEDLNVPVIIHPGRDKRSPAESLRLYAEAGGRTSRCVMSHLERTIFSHDDLLEFATMGSYIEFDLFGNETSYYEVVDDIDMPSDAVRIKRLAKLISDGYLDRILISHDIHTKHRLMEFGGHGFSHVLLNTIPKMKKRGFTQEQIHKITVENPKRWLTI